MSDADDTYTVTVSSKGQITIPAAIRESYGLVQGDRVRFFLASDGKLHMIPVTGALADLAGRLADTPRLPPDPDPLGAALSEDDARIRRAAGLADDAA